eukprot:767876-Hanusia_phi.AAC.3
MLEPSGATKLSQTPGRMQTSCRDHVRRCGAAAEPYLVRVHPHGVDRDLRVRVSQRLLCGRHFKRQLWES